MANSWQLRGSLQLREEELYVGLKTCNTCLKLLQGSLQLREEEKYVGLML